MNWVGDKVCDSKCENIECAWDGGDCGMNVIWDGSIHGIKISKLQIENSQTEDQHLLPLTKTTEQHLLPSGGNNGNSGNDGNTGNGSSAIDVVAAALILQIQKNSNMKDVTPQLPVPELIGLLPPPSSSTPFPFYLIPSGHAAMYVNMSDIFPSSPADASTILLATHDNPSAIGNSIVLQHHKVMILLFLNDEDAKKKGRSITNIRVEGNVLKDIICNDTDGTVLNRTYTAVHYEFEISTNAAGDDNIGQNTKNDKNEEEKEKEKNINVPLVNEKDRIEIHVRNNTNSTVAIATKEHRDESATVYLPSDKSAGVVQLTHNTKEKEKKENTENLDLSETIEHSENRSRHLLSTATLSSSSSTARPISSHHHGRRLLDIYGDSLVNVNMMYHARFGKASRKVPAHMPHMIDVDVMNDLWTEYPNKFSQTSGRRFRGGEDMQFSFAHFYWLIHKIPERDLKSIWNFDLDVDGDGKLSINELRSLTAIVEGQAPDENQILEITKCLRPPIIEDVVEETALGTVHSKRTTYPHATFGQFMQCTRAVNKVKENWRMPPTHTIMTLDEVTFEMIGDDYNHTKEQLDGIRAKRTKFICVNDDMHHPSVALQDMLHDFYEAMFAKPSPFELPKGKTNAYLNTNKMRSYFQDNLKEKNEEKTTFFILVGLCFVGFLLYIFCFRT